MKGPKEYTVEVDGTRFKFRSNMDWPHVRDYLMLVDEEAGNLKQRLKVAEARLVAIAATLGIPA